MVDRAISLYKPGSLTYLALGSSTGVVSILETTCGSSSAKVLVLRYYYFQDLCKCHTWLGVLQESRQIVASEPQISLLSYNQHRDVCTACHYFPFLYAEVKVVHFVVVTLQYRNMCVTERTQCKGGGGRSPPPVCNSSCVSVLSVTVTVTAVVHFFFAHVVVPPACHIHLLAHLCC